MEWGCVGDLWQPSLSCHERVCSISPSKCDALSQSDSPWFPTPFSTLWRCSFCVCVKGSCLNEHPKRRTVCRGYVWFHEANELCCPTTCELGISNCPLSTIMCSYNLYWCDEGKVFSSTCTMKTHTLKITCKRPWKHKPCMCCPAIWLMRWNGHFLH